MRGNAAADVLEGMAVLEKLHRQVLPFVLRREKSHVLTDLPPKTVTDVVCDMSAAQQAVYDSISAAAASSGVLSSINSAKVSICTATCSTYFAVPPN
jgi:TATA-binding protein-associated factor